MSRVGNSGMGWMGAALAALALPAWGQYPGRVAPTNPASGPHLRATAVLEYTGTLDHITASRLVPVAVWDGLEYEPGALYLADPAPLAVLGGTQYELESDGRSRGFFNISDSEQLAGLWIGVGRYQAPAVVAKLKQGRNLPYVVGGGKNSIQVDPDKPHFAHVPPSDSSQSGQTASASGGPTLHTRPVGASDDSGSPAESAPASQPAPTLGDESEGPTLHRRGAAAQSGSASTLPIDPDRPHLSYANPNADAAAGPTALLGLPAEMKQAAAVSDNRKLDTESFAYVWASPDDAAKMQSQMETLAQQALASPPAAPPAQTSRTRGRRARTQPPAPPTLEAVQFHAFTLSFGGGSTLVLSAESGDDPVKFVTIVAQPDFYGNLQVLLKQVTSNRQLDAVPQMRLIDAVDTTGNGVADLLMELRGDTYRQFAIYRLYGGAATQVFLSQPIAIPGGAAAASSGL